MALKQAKVEPCIAEAIDLRETPILLQLNNN